MPILTEEVAEKLDQQVLDLPFSTRAQTVMATVMIRTVRDLAARSAPELLKTKGCGPKVLKEMETVLEGLGLALGMGLPQEQISGVSIVELAVAWATRTQISCAYTEPVLGHESLALVRVHSLHRYGSGVDDTKIDYCGELSVQVLDTFDRYIFAYNEGTRVARLELKDKENTHSRMPPEPFRRIGGMF